MLTVQMRRCCVTQHRSTNGFRCHVLWQPKPITITWGAQIEMTGLRSCVEYVGITSGLVGWLWSSLCGPHKYVIHDNLVPHNQSGHRNITFHAFVDKLCHELIGSYRRTDVMRRNSAALVYDRLVNSGPTPQHLVKGAANASANNIWVFSERYNLAKHQNPRAREADLPKRSKTVYRCSTCKMFLCIGVEADNCFVAHHSRKEYWR